MEDDSFEMGAHSLSAVRMPSQIELELELKARLASILKERAYVEGMTAVIGASHGDGVETRHFEPVQSRESEPVLFFVCPDEATMLTLRHFAGPVGSERRLLGLLPERIGRRFDQTCSIEQLAEAMLVTIRVTQPRGPYVLAGFSVGGLIAYEIASRLHLDGETVARIWILDSAYGPDVYLRELWPHTPWGVMARFLHIGPWAAMQVAGRLVRRLVIAPLVRLHVHGPVRDEFDYRGAVVLGSKYAPDGHEVPMDLFTSGDSVDGTGSPTLGWENVHRGPITRHMIPGKHIAMLTEPNVRVVAEIMRDRLRSALAACSPGPS